MLTSCQDRVVVTSKNVNKKIRRSLSAYLIPLHSREKKHFLYYLSFSYIAIGTCNLFVTYKKLIFRATFFVFITRRFSKSTFYFRLYFGNMKLGHERRKRRFDVHDRYAGIYLRHIFTKYFLFLFLLPVYVDTYLKKNNILTTRFFISKCACAKIHVKAIRFAQFKLYH